MALLAEDFLRHSPFALLGGCATRFSAQAEKINLVSFSLISPNPYKAQTCSPSH